MEASREAVAATTKERLPVLYGSSTVPVRWWFRARVAKHVYQDERCSPRNRTKEQSKHARIHQCILFSMSLSCLRRYRYCAVRKVRAHRIGWWYLCSLGRYVQQCSKVEAFACTFIRETRVVTKPKRSLIFHRPRSRSKIQRYPQPNNENRATTMTFEAMYEKVSKADGFLAALDQSGGSTPKALKAYGIPDDVS